MLNAYDDLNKLVPVIVLGKRHELLGRVDPVLGLAHGDGGSVGPNPRENQVIAGNGKERKIEIEEIMLFSRLQSKIREGSRPLEYRRWW